MPTVRRPAVAGSFYPADPTLLSEHVTDMLADAAAGLPPKAPVPKALVLPHAGYIYSGSMAARGYARLIPARGQVKRVVLLGPAHRVPVRGLALPGAEQLETPLGVLPVDSGGCTAAAACPGVLTYAAAHRWEHSLEVHLPFIQEALGKVSIVPLVVGAATPEQVAGVIDALWGGPETAMVVSSDLSHYLPHELAVQVDETTISEILSLSDQISHDQACGASPLNGLLLAARRRSLRAELLGRCTSADTAGEPDRVVGYCAVALHEAALRQDGLEPPEDAGTVLLPLARRVITAAIGATPSQPVSANPKMAPDPAWLHAPGAAFVTLRRPDGSLRGCIGSLEAHRPLGQDVAANAVAAATRDPRFKPVLPEELPGLRIEVSVLTAPEPLGAQTEAEVLRALRPGVDGVILRRGTQRATFLPQVWEELAEPRDFLRHLKRKGGWAPGFWDEHMRVETYQVRAWEEP